MAKPYRFRCDGCGTEAKQSREGARVRLACQECDAVTDWERIGEVEA